MPHILSAVTRFPPHHYTQDEISAAILRILNLPGEPAAQLQKFCDSVEVDGRYLALPLDAYEDLDDFGARNDLWIDAALDLAEQTVCDLLDQAAVPPEKVAALAFTTVTGIAVPSIDARLMNRVPFSPALKRMPFFGWGCCGGASGFARLNDYLLGHPDEIGILLAVELCSLTIQRTDFSMANLVSSALFGDGAAAVLMAGDNVPARPNRPRVVDTRSFLFPQTEYMMGWEVRDTGFKMVLSSDVAEVAGSRLAPELARFLADHDLRPDDIGRWILHHGGPKVINAVESSLGLPAGALDLSRLSLAQAGNVSSASVLMMLDDTLRQPPPPAGTYGFLMAMGPGFAAEMALLQW